ncbi:MAG: hypothetical protein IT260_10510, partial [Saprospiraceae bacterium]|nr:hypothetical protein [Saprospiraceae bacterium]
MKIPALLFCLFWATASFGQLPGFRILFVDDSPDGFGNAEYLASALDSLSYDYVYLDVAGTGNLPDSTTYADFDMVIWHTSTNGVGNYLWNGDDTDNAALAAYLDGGGYFWLIGNDFLYDRYGATPYNFEETDFAYQYLGIASYDLQSYGDD